MDTAAGGVCMVETASGPLSAYTTQAVAAGRAVTVALRPERLRVLPSSEGAAGLTATVVQHVYLGNKTEVHATLMDDTRCVLELPNDGQQRPAPIGQTITLAADAAGCRLFPVD